MFYGVDKRKMLGVDEETVLEMVDMGYRYMDIEEMLCETENDCYEGDAYAEI